MKRLSNLLIVCTLAQALQTVRPNAEWVIRGTTYSELAWLDKSQSKPTLGEVNAAISNCQIQEAAARQERSQAILDAKNTSKTTQERIDALIKAIDLK